MKKVMVLLLTLLLILSLFGCGAASAPKDAAAASDMAVAEEGGWEVNYDQSAPAAEESKGVWDGGEAGVAKAQGKEAKIVYTAEMSMQTLEFDQAVAQITQTVEKNGGYFAQSSTNGSGNNYRYASYTVKVPAEKFKSFLTELGEICHVTYTSTTAEDISDTYYDVDSRLTTAKTKLARLQELLTQAKDMNDIITIESAITDTEWQIENLSGTLRNYDAQVDYATVYLDVNEVYKLSGTDEAPVTLGKRIGNAFTGGLQSVGNFLEDAVVWLAYSWIWLIVLAACVFAGVKLGKKVRNKRRAKKET